MIKMSEVKIKPLGTRVLIEPQEAETKTASGIIIPDSAKEKPQKGKIVAAGKGTKEEEMEVKVGDTVLYGKYSGTEITVDGKEYLIMSQSDIFAIV
jgi:chaperonin GroES